MITSPVVKRYKFQHPVNPQGVGKVLQNNGIKLKTSGNDSLYLSYSGHNFAIHFNRSHTLITIRMQITPSWFLQTLLPPLLIMALKISLENYLTESLNNIATVFAVVFVVGWVIYQAIFKINRLAKPFIRLFENLILKK